MKALGFSLVVCILAVSVSAEDHGNSEVVSRIVAMEKAWNQAYKLRDKKALDNILDDAIVLVNDDGSLQTKAAFLSGIQFGCTLGRATGFSGVDCSAGFRQRGNFNRSLCNQGS